MATPQVTVTMSQSTFSALMNGGFKLYGYTAVQCSDQAGMPAVWFCNQDYGLNTAVSVPSIYAAFTAPVSPLAPGSKLNPWFNAPIEPGQILEVSQGGGTGTVKNGGDPGVITILNQTNTQYTCGLIQGGQSESGSTPTCGFQLYGNGIELITPLPSILLYFSTVPAIPGTLVEVSTGPGIFINLANGNSPTISFDINKGWSWGGYGWAQSVPANVNLRPILIQYSQTLATLRNKEAEARLSNATA